MKLSRVIILCIEEAGALSDLDAVPVFIGVLRREIKRDKALHRSFINSIVASIEQMPEEEILKLIQEFEESRQLQN